MTEICDFTGFEDLLEHDWTDVVEEMEKAISVVLEVDVLLTEMIEQVQMKIAEAELPVVAINDDTDPLLVALEQLGDKLVVARAHVIDLTAEEVNVVGKKRVYDLIDLTGND